MRGSNNRLSSSPTTHHHTLLLLLLLQLTALAHAQDPSTTSSSVTTTLTDQVSTTLDTRPQPDPSVDDCRPEDVNFELVTGFLMSTPTDMLDSRIGTLLLSDCVDTCRTNATCRGFNYETGLCVLIDSTADQDPEAMTESQFPVFTMYLQKMCYASSKTSSPAAKKCSKAWAFERVMNHTLEGHIKYNTTVETRVECETACLEQTDFVCRSAAFESSTGLCSLSDMDRHTTAGLGLFRSQEGTDYLENNCVEEPVKLCEFREIDSRILKTVDAVHQDVANVEECRQLCMNANFRCHTYDYDEVADGVCRLSHHSVATLTHIEEPYLEIPNATSYELSSCYNVTIDCRAGDMVARVKTSKVFSGKLYAKNSPSGCMTDVDGALEFDLAMGYDDLECNVEREERARYANDIVLQHHDRIITRDDITLRVHCQYDLSNQTVVNTVDLEVQNNIKPVLEEQAIVELPNVVMRITDRDGSQLKAASVGDPLSLHFEIADIETPYEIFVRDVMAMDGSAGNEIQLFDERGCPTDETIMGAINKVNNSKTLSAPFHAFKFPSSDVVQFRAIVTPCLSRCEPVNCEVSDIVGNTRQVDSYGRRRRRRSTENTDDLLVVQTIRIEDRFVKPHGQQLTSSDDGSVYVQNGGSRVRNAVGIDTCINTVHLVIGSTAFLLLQLLILIGWLFVCQHRRRLRNKTMLDDFPETTTNSLAQLYDSGYTARRS